MNDQQPESVWQLSAEIVSTLVRSFIYAAAIVLFVMQVTTVQGFSMEPNLHTDQRLIIDKISYEFFEPARGDVVVLELSDSDLPLIKRVVAVAGETVEIRDNIIYINGQQLLEPWQTNLPMANYGPLVVPSEHVFVMGDNRPVSRDSRSFGPVDVYRIMGQARFSLWPPENVGLIR